MHDAPFLTALCIAPGTEKELSALVTEFHRQDYIVSRRELVIIDDGPVNQQLRLTHFLPSLGEDIAVHYHHSPQRLFAEEKVQLGMELAKGDWFHFMTVNTCYPCDYFRHAVSQAQSSEEKMIGFAQETLWLSPLKRLCSRKTRLAWYSALNALCCHRSVMENNAFLLSANGREASLARPFVDTVAVNPPVTYCHDIMAIIRNGLLLNTTLTGHSLLGALTGEFQPEKSIDWHFFYKIACISLNERPGDTQAFRAQLDALQAPSQKTMWFPVNKGHSPVAGRMQAWLEVLRTARDNSWENVLILEDDIQFVRQDSIVEKVNTLLASLADRAWQGVLFSAQYHNVSLLTEIPNTVTVHNAVAIGACAVHKSYFATLIDFFEQLLNKFLSAQNPEEVQPDHFWHILMQKDSWLGLWPSWGFRVTEFNDAQNSVTDTVPLFFRPLVAIDDGTRSQIEGPLLERVKHFQATPQVYAALAEFNHEMQRYELVEYYKFKEYGRLPPVRKDESWPLLSVIIPTYNQVGYLKETLESIRRQSYPNMEIVVADDCSTDGTQSYMETVIDPRLNYVRNSTNLGLTNNFQSAFEKYVKGEYLYCIGHDDLLLDLHYLWDAVQLFENDKYLSLVFSNYYDWYETSNIITSSYIGCVINRINGKEYFINYNCKYRNLQPVVTLYRRQDLIQAQAIKYSKHAQVEDLHAILRVMLFGDVAFFPAFSAIYRRHEKSITFNQGGDHDIRPDIAFMQDMEKTRELAVQQGIPETLLSDWLLKISVSHFVGWRLPIAFSQGKYACILSLLAWLNKYYPDIGRTILIHLLARK